MPLYDYDCAACGRRIEVVHGVHAPGPTHCPNCGSGPLKKAIVAPAVHFKGSGWAKRDRRVTVAPGTSKASGDPETASEGRSDKETAGSTEPASSDGGATPEPSMPSSKASGVETGTATKTGA
jgi:putative FmdB family regulatory protein